jgi:hypothetical protein
MEAFDFFPSEIEDYRKKFEAQMSEDESGFTSWDLGRFMQAVAEIPAGLEPFSEIIAVPEG